ncbi:unnamed protein product [Lactuca virosa]|uniref:Uncharacterized protein n=1 Tax=Lactuca virosa TaxID=75947 RepID=A0AAU9P7D3_9ASTR|nr:unnamed protein product [Lactuca virosa]
MIAFQGRNGCCLSLMCLGGDSKGTYSFYQLLFAKAFPLPAENFLRDSLLLLLFSLPSYSTLAGEAPNNPSGVPLVVLPPPAPSEWPKEKLFPTAIANASLPPASLPDCYLSSEEVISILDEDTHQYEGTSKQPILNKDPTVTGPTEPPPVHKGKSPVVSETSEYDELIASFQGKNLSSNYPFIPKWNLTDKTRLSQQEVVAEFSHHAFLKGTVSEMEAFTDDQKIDSMEFAYAKTPFSSLQGLTTFVV